MEGETASSIPVSNKGYMAGQNTKQFFNDENGAWQSRRIDAFAL